MAQSDSHAWRDKELMQDLYIDQRLSCAAIADKFGTYPNLILKWLNRHNIDTRTNAEANTDGDIGRLHNEDWLEKQYADKRRSTSDIGEELDVSAVTVSKRLKMYGIEVRDSYAESTDAKSELLSNADYLRRKYHTEGLTLYDLGDELNCAPQTVRYWLMKHGIKTDSPGPPFGEDNPLWTDRPDIDTYYGPDWPRKRLKVIIRDQARCQRCGVSESKQMEDIGYSLSVHHIIPRTEYINDGEVDYGSANSLTNLITLCRKCHQKIERIPIDVRYLI